MTDEFPCTWIEDAGMWAGAIFLTAVAAATGWCGPELADLLNTFFFNT